MSVGAGRDLGLAFWQIRYELRAYWRNRQRAVFTFVFPLMFLVVFGSIFKNHYTQPPHRIPYDRFFVPGILAYGVITTTYVNMAISTSILRDQGVLKRMQGTPLPRWAYLAARIATTVLIVFGITVLVLALGRLAYNVPVRWSTMPAVVVALVLGTTTFTTLGIGITRWIKTAEGAPVVVNLTVLPLTFISGIWFPMPIPSALHHIAEVFPMQPLAHALQHAFNPYTTGAGFSGSDLRTLGIWAVVGIYLMLRVLNRPEGDLG